MERKRHLGNDIAVIIYIESNDDEYPMGAALSFDPSNIKSKFNRILKLVKFYVSRMHTLPPHTYMYTHYTSSTHNTLHTRTAHRYAALILILNCAYHRHFYLFVSL